MLIKLGLLLLLIGIVRALLNPRPPPDGGHGGHGSHGASFK